MDAIPLSRMSNANFELFTFRILAPLGLWPSGAETRMGAETHTRSARALRAIATADDAPAPAPPEPRQAALQRRRAKKAALAIVAARRPKLPKPRTGTGSRPRPKMSDDERAARRRVQQRDRYAAKKAALGVRQRKSPSGTPKATKKAHHRAANIDAFTAALDREIENPSTMPEDIYSRAVRTTRGLFVRVGVLLPAMGNAPGYLGAILRDRGFEHNCLCVRSFTGRGLVKAWLRPEPCRH